LRLKTFVPLNSRLDSNIEETKGHTEAAGNERDFVRESKGRAPRKRISARLGPDQEEPVHPRPSLRAFRVWGLGVGVESTQYKLIVFSVKITH